MNKAMRQDAKIVGADRLEEFYDRVDRIKYGDTKSVDEIRKDFGDEAADRAQEILDRFCGFCGKYVGSIFNL